MFSIEVHPIAIGGAIALPLYPLKVKKHMIPDHSNERQVRNTSIDQAQHAKHSGISMEDRFQIQRRNRYTDPHAGAHEKEWWERLPHFPQGRVTYFHVPTSQRYGSDPRGSAESVAIFAMDEKPESFWKAEAGRNANDEGSTHGNQARQITSSLLKVRNTMQSRKVCQCSVERSAGAKLIVDHFFRGITRDNGDVQKCEKNLVFPSSAIEHQDGIAGSKDVSKHFPHGSALGADPRAREEVVIPPG
jgi:hypothetical protein